MSSCTARMDASSTAYAHMCRDEHQQIGHNDSEHERCPLCRANDNLDYAMARIQAEVSKAFDMAQSANDALRAINTICINQTVK